MLLYLLFCVLASVFFQIDTHEPSFWKEKRNPGMPSSGNHR